MLLGRGGPKNGVGLEIGASAIKIVEARRDQRGNTELVHLTIVPTPPEGIQDGVIADADVLAEAIRDALRTSGIKQKTIVTAISGNSAIIRTINTPAMPDEDLEEAVNYEAERYIPFSIEDAVIGYHVLDTIITDNAEETKLLMVAVQRELIDQYINTLNMAGLTPKIIDVKPFASLRALQAMIVPNVMDIASFEIEGEIDRGTAIVVVEIGADETSISLVRNGTLEFTSCRISAGNDITEAIQRGLGIDYAQAEQIKKEVGSAVVDVDLDTETVRDARTGITFTPAKINEFIVPVLSDLVNDIRGYLDFYKVQEEDVIIQKLILTGGTAKLKGIVDFMTDKLGIPTEIGNSWRSMTYDPERFAPEYMDDISPSMAVGVGLAMRGCAEK